MTEPQPQLASCPMIEMTRPGIALSADGRHCVQVSAGIGRLDGRALVTGAIAATLVDRAAWFVTRGDAGDELRRFDLDGVACGAAVALGALGAQPVITAARTGARVVLIEGDRAIVVRERERGGEVGVEPLGARGRDRRVHLAGRGILERRGNALAVGAGTSAGLVLPADLLAANVVSGAFAFDGAAVMVELDANGVRSLVVYDARRAELRNRVRLGEAGVAATTERRGVVVIGRGRHLALLDLRSGRCTHERIMVAAVASVAASADGERIVVIDEAGMVTELTAALGDALGDAASEASSVAECVMANDTAIDALAIDAETSDASMIEAPASDACAPADVPPTTTEAAIEAADTPVASAATPAASAALRPRRIDGALDKPATRHFLDDTYELIAAWCDTATTLARGVDGDAAITQMLAARKREGAAFAAVARWDQLPTPLAVLAADFGLSPLACSLLTIAAAPQIWGELARAYGALTADPARPLVDELLACQILELPRGARVDLTRELDDGAPLVRHGLIVVGRGARPFASLEVPHTVIRRLTGDRFDADPGNGAGSTIVRRVADRTLAQLRAPRAQIAALVAELAHAPATGEVRVVVRGRSGAGRRTLAAALAAQAGRELGVIELVGAGADAVAALRRDLGDTHLRGWLACVIGADAVAGDDVQRAAVRAALDAHPGPLFVTCGVGGSAPLATGHLVVELPGLGVAERAATWRDAMIAHALPTDDAAALAERYAVGPGAIYRAVAATAAAENVAGVGARIDRILRQRRAVQLGALATRVEHLGSWADLVLPDELLASVRELVARVRLRSTVLDAWGMDHVASTGRAVTALLQGGPGTGKTMVAGVIARELGYDLYRVDLSRVTSKWIGETEKNLGQLFDAAEDGQCILLFDEADSLFGKRTDVRSSNDHHANLQVNYLLQRLDAFEGVAILTTNFGTAIDPAFKRRLSLHLQFPFPDDSERERLWRAHLPSSLPVAGDLELAALARKYELSGGYIRNAALRAAYLAADERTAVTADHLRRAVQAEYRDRGKVATTGALE